MAWYGVEAKMKMASVVFMLSLFLSLVHCQQTFPYVSFMGQTLANHSYVDLSTVGNADDNSDSVVCHTDLDTCCSGAQGIHRGTWSFPDGTRLPFSGPSVPISLGRAARIAVIRRTSGTGPTGIYRCDIQTIAVHDDSDNSVRDTVYVGLYTGSGGIMYCTFCPIIIHRVFKNLIFLFHRRCDNTRRYNSYCAL